MKTLNEKQIKKTEKRLEEINKIPDYDNVFRDTKRNKNQDNKIVTAIFKKQWFKIILSVILFVIKACPILIIPIITSSVIDEVTLGANANVKKLIVYAAIIAVCLIQNIPTHIIYSRITDNILRKTSAGLKATVIRKLQRLSITYHKEIESGKLQSKFMRDTENIDAYFRQLLTSVLPTIANLITAVVIALYRSPIVALFFVVVIPANIILTRAFRKPIRKSNRELRIQTENVSAKLAQMLEMLQVTKAHGLEDEEISRFEHDIRDLTRKGLDVDKTTAYFGSTTWVVANTFSCLCLFFTAFMAIKGVSGFTAGSIVLYQSLFSQINGYIQGIINAMPQLAVGKESIHSVSEIMNSDDIENNRGKRKIEKINGNVDFNDVYYRYPGANEDMIKDFCLHVKHGECIAFVGSSGSGKSTIMNMIIGFLKPTRGTLLIDGENIENLDLSEYRHSISVVPQNSILFDGTVRENITYGLSRYTEEELQKAVEMSNVSEFLPELKDGLDTRIGEHGGKLSGGQKQRITIARALIRNPSILILDEATSALDNVSEYHVQKAIETARRNRTTFIVAHRLSTIRNADRIVVMENGVIKETGTYEELMALKGKFYELKSLNDIATKSVEG